MTIDNPKAAPVGVFDSGVGGLTVMKEIVRQMPGENIIYFGDTARVPYGSKSKDTIVRFSGQILRFLRQKQVKAVVIACNTASALALEVVGKQFAMPIRGVIEPGARAAVETTCNQKVGVIGTEATVGSHMYARKIQQRKAHIQVLEKACPLFVPLVEEGLLHHQVTGEMIAYYLQSVKESGVDTVILGCTHYPLLQTSIQTYLGQDIQIVNPAWEAAKDLQKLLQERHMENDIAGCSGQYEFYVSDAAEKFREFANTVMPFPVPQTTVVNIEEY